jgi:dTDP-4-dehydrorhamnose 3,5-epimerase
MPTDIIPFAVEHTEIAGLEILQMKQITDERGTVREFYRESSFLEAGLPSLGPWLQVNITETRQGALRGLHGEQMFKLVAVVEGEAFGAYLDARPDSPSRGTTVTVKLAKGARTP